MEIVPDTKDEARWRAEFEAAGETEIRDHLDSAPFDERKRQFAFHWLREQAKARTLREQQMHSYTRRTFWVAVAAVIVGIIGIVATLLH